MCWYPTRKLSVNFAREAAAPQGCAAKVERPLRNLFVAHHVHGLTAHKRFDVVNDLVS